MTGPVRDDAQAAAFIRANTRVGATPLIPEIRLHLSDAVTPLWQATEDWLERNGLDPPYWAFAWAGGQALARYLLDHPERAAGRRVVDVAGGCGIAGLAAAMAGAAPVLVVDLDPMAAAAVRLNAAVNGLPVRADVGDATALPVPAADLILAGDVFYERPMSDALLPWLRRQAAAGALVLVGDPGRAYAPQSGIESLAAYEVPVARDLEDRPVRTTQVLRILGDAGNVGTDN